MRIILASSSPRRKQLLKKLVDEFDVIVSDVDETEIKARDNAEFVRKASYLKARAVADGLTEGIVIGADTIVALDGEMIGKPLTEERAYAMHRKLQGRAHDVLTGVTVIDASTGEYITDHVSTKVKLKPYTDEDIRPYIETKTPLTCAGAYCIWEERFTKFVDSAEGDFFSVVGLPLQRLKEMLEHFGVKTLQPPQSSSKS